MPDLKSFFKENDSNSETSIPGSLQRYDNGATGYYNNIGENTDKDNSNLYIHFARLLDSIDEMYYSYDVMNRRMFFISEACERIFGLPRNRFLEDPLLLMHLIHHDDLLHVNNAMTKLRMGSLAKYEFRIITPGGQTKWLEARAAPFINHNGELESVDYRISDISQNKINERILVERNNELILLYETNKLLSETLDLNEQYDRIYHILQQVTECDQLSISSYDENEKTIKYIFIRDKRDDKPLRNLESIPPVPLAPEGLGLQSEVIRTGKAVIVDDYNTKLRNTTKTCINIVANDSIVSNDSNKILQENKDNFTPNSGMIVPVILNGRVTGVMQILSVKDKAYNDSDLKLVECITHGVGAATKNAALYQKAQDEIWERCVAEDRIKETLHEKELLLKELHHRVTNNLQIISSLLNIQSGYINSPELKTYFDESRHRIESIGLIHQNLYRNKELSVIDVKKYMQNLTCYLYGCYHKDPSKISFNLDSQNIYMDIDTAVSFGLIINELVSNSLKHAFNNSDYGKIDLDILYENSAVNLYTVVYKDNGIGIPENFNLDNPKTLGLRLVKKLTEQLNGKIEIDKESGIKIKLRFPPANYKNRMKNA